MKQALFWKKLKAKDEVVQCQLCPHYCTLKPGEKGKCKVRQNKNGNLCSLVYSHPCAVSIDPIEKKPLYHFLPGQKALSIATVGCNLKCKHCQNWQISQLIGEDINSEKMIPKQVIKKAKQENVKIISYTYTEPTIFYEYMLDIAKLAKQQGIKNTIVSNGFINPKPLKQLCKYLDAANIDIKSMSDGFYKKTCGAKLNPVLETLKILKKQRIWIEITNLLIPGLNDKEQDIKKLVRWIRNNLGVEVPIHFTAFYPCYKLSHLPPTSIETLKKARDIALEKGIKYVYTGNLPDEHGNDTFCPKCGSVLIKRKLFSIIENNIKKGKCINCNIKIKGFWGD
jgi:pyruvate formate lyase activating enzyme